MHGFLQTGRAWLAHFFQRWWAMILVILAILALAIPITLAFIKAEVDLWIIITFLIALVLFFVISIWMYHNKENIEKKHKDEQPLESYGEAEAVLPRNKLMLVVKAIIEAEQNTRKGCDVAVYITDDNGLSRIYPSELKEILLKLQDDEGVLTLKTFPDWLLESDSLTQTQISQKIGAMIKPERNNFTINISKRFAKFLEM